MAIEFRCPHCDRRIRVKSHLGGRRVKCPDCAEAIEIPDEYSASVGGIRPRDPLYEKPGIGAVSRPRRASRRRSRSSGNSVKWMLIVLIGAPVGLILLCCGGLMLIGYQASEEQRKIEESIVEGHDTPFLERRAGFESSLTDPGPAPQEYDSEQPPPGVEEVTYNSGDLALKAWVQRPEAGPERKPVLVFFHGGFAFGAGDLEGCRPFVDAGFIVMAPMFRGENGNPGSFELFLGEVDDAKAAVQWIAAQPDVDPSRIYTFGHSVGGGVSAVLSLMDDVPIQHGGGSGGLYPPSVFDEWWDTTPFEGDDPREWNLRILIGNQRDMQHKHYAYLGTQDDAFTESARLARREMPSDSQLEIIQVPGDHFTSFAPALQRYLQVTASEASPEPARQR
ncbi:MAG: hypothetical protein CMJ48_07645 [Planctomycetaceae bacterium]|nr:hypothetical protein [Planctomycetaceae bacterium]